MPEFPRTMHLPIEPNTSAGDKVATFREMEAFLGLRVSVEEKLDGANMGLAVIDGQPLVRNRSHILRKGYSARKTPAQQQFGRVWTWLHEVDGKVRNYEKVLLASEIVGSPVTVYGEWLFARHVVEYDALPDLFVAYDLWHQAEGRFLDPFRTKMVLEEAGFKTPKMWAYNLLWPDLLVPCRDKPSAFSSTAMQEGIYLKSGDGEWGHGRYKMVAPWFRSDDGWNKRPLVRNTLGAIPEPVA